MALALASAQGGGSNDNNGNDSAVVYRAVRDGASADQVRAILAGGPRTRRAHQEWLAAVVNHKNEADGETALKAAHRRRDGPLVGVLLEAGANATAIARRCHPLALAIHYGLIDTLRVLLRSGRYDANEKVRYSYNSAAEGDSTPYYMGGDASSADDEADRYHGRRFCRPVHLAIVPPRRFEGGPGLPPQLEALSVLVREFGADINAYAQSRATPLHWLTHAPREHRLRALDALLSLGADLDKRGDNLSTAIFPPALTDAALLQHFLSRGASPDVRTLSRTTPLMQACRADPTEVQAAVPALLPVSSLETRRTVDREGKTAIDWLIDNHHLHERWCHEVIAELLPSRVPVHSSNAGRVLPIAARLADRLEAQAAKRNRAGAMHVARARGLVGIGDLQELRQAEAWGGGEGEARRRAWRRSCGGAGSGRGTRTTTRSRTRTRAGVEMGEENEAALQHTHTGAHKKESRWREHRSLSLSLSLRKQKRERFFGRRFFFLGPLVY